MSIETWIAAAFLGVAAVLLFRRVLTKLVKYILRGGVGALMILLFNSALGMAGLGFMVGVNAITVLTVAFLGVPGLITLYAASAALA